MVVPVGPGADTALDTLDSVARYCEEPHLVVIVEDCTADGTYEALLSHKRENWHILRNPRPTGVRRLVHGLSLAYRFILEQSNCGLILRLDQDALIIKPGVIGDAAAFAEANPNVGLFGVYDVDYNRPRSFDAHRELMNREMSAWRRLMGLQPFWAPLLELAERRGYPRGTNVFGGAYFVTRKCLEGMAALGALAPPWNWHSVLMEDVYFSMAAVAAGFDLGHFAAPTGPLCLEWRGLPYPADEFIQNHYKLVHSVDKGSNVTREANGGKTAREVFKALRDSSPGRDAKLTIGGG